AEIIPVICAGGEDDGPVIPANQVLAEEAGNALASACTVVTGVSAGGEKLLVVRAHDLHQVSAGHQRLILAQQMRPLCGTPDDLFRDVLQVGEGFAIAVGSNGRKALIVPLYLAVGTDHERVVAELLIVAERTFAHSRIVSLNGRTVVAKFGVKTPAGGDSTFLSDVTSDGQLQRGVSRVGGSIDEA